MSLFDSASLVVTPNGVKEGKLYSIKPTDGSGDLSVVRATTATRVNSSGLVESVATNVPRLDYTNGSCPSILVEPQRTNLLIYSNDFISYWSNDGKTTREANTSISPDGTNNSTKMVGAGGYAYRFAPMLSVGDWTFSIYFKASGNSSIDISINDLGGSGQTNKSISVTTNWQRFDITKNITLGTTVILSFSGLDAGIDYYVYNAQLEQGSYPTSLIPTTSASVTRNADVISKTGISSLIGQTEGTIFCDVINSKTILDTIIISLSDGTFSNYLQLSTNSSTGNLQSVIFTGGGASALGTITTNVNQRYKIAIAYKLNDYALYINGVQIGTLNSKAAPTLLTRLDISGLSWAAEGYIYSNPYNSAVLWKERLDNETLATLTTI